jgi:DNA-binding LytR/AlgR family response regulator
LIKTGDKFTYIETKDIAYFMADGNIIYAVTRENKKYIIGFSLEDLEKTLNPDEFIRATRKYLLHISSIRKVSKYFNSRLKVEISPAPADDEILVSRVKSKLFLDWLDGTTIIMISRFSFIRKLIPFFNTD